MKRRRLSQIITDFAAKKLTAHEVDPSVSNGHEFQGVNALRQILGKDRIAAVPCTFIYLPAEGEAEPDTVDASLSWYDSRERDPGRSAEWRLYYDRRAGQLVQSRAQPGDLFALAKLTDGRFIVFLAPNRSTVEQQVLYLLGPSKEPSLRFEVGTARDREIGLVEESILASIGIQTPDSPDPEAGSIAETIFRECSGTLPSTSEFSLRAQQTFAGSDPSEDPDAFIVEIMEWETALFRLFEEKLIARRLEAGFNLEGG